MQPRTMMTKSQFFLDYINGFEEITKYIYYTINHNYIMPVCLDFMKEQQCTVLVQEPPIYCLIDQIFFKTMQ